VQARIVLKAAAVPKICIDAPTRRPCAEVVVTARVTQKLDDRRVRVDLVATCAGEKVLGQARAVVALP